MPSPDLPRAARRLVRRGRRRRRVWVDDGLAYIEVKPTAEPHRFAHSLTSVLTANGRVHWAAVNEALARAVIAFEDDGIDPDELVSVVEAVERSFGIDDDPFPLDAPSFPGDPQIVLRPLIALTADAAALGASSLGLALRWTPLPVEVASAVGLLDAHPRSRRALAAALGPTTADITLALANALGQALSQGPVGLTVDLTHRALQVAEGRAHQKLWAERHDELAGQADRHATRVVDRRRPTPMPSGPVERYADGAALASLGAFGVASVLSRAPRRSVGLLLAFSPKPARLGREAFAAQLARALAARGILVMNQHVLRLLDRVDTVVVDAPLLLSGRHSIVDRSVVDDTADADEATRVLGALFDSASPFVTRRDGDWELRPEPDQPTGPDLAGRLELRRAQRVVAHARVEPDLRREGVELVKTARSVGFMVAIAGVAPAVVRRAGASLAVDGGEQLAEAVRTLQRDGCCVTLVSSTDTAALIAADCGIGVRMSVPPPWGADLLCGSSFEDARFVVEATAIAAEASRQSVALAMTSAGVASLLAVNSRWPLATARAMTAVNVASGVALGNGFRAAWRFDRRYVPLPEPAPPWHELEPDATLRVLDTSLDGLSADEAASRQTNGHRPSNPITRFVKAVGDELINPLTPIMAAGAAASASIGSVLDAGMVATVVALNGLVGGVQRFRAQETIRELEARRPQDARVRREGRNMTAPAREVVPGDVITLEAGEVVPADARLLDAETLEIDESALTGESLPVQKSVPSTSARLVADRTSMLYAGTTVAAGEATAVVVATGRHTEASAGSGNQHLAGGVEARLQQLNRLTLPAVLTGGGALVVSGLLRGRSLRDTLHSGVSLAVAAVPEGLPILATLAQLSAAKRLAASGALVRNTRAVEALGRIEVLCVDKTGTLTEGRIALDRISDGETAVDLGHLDRRHRDVLGAALRATPAPESGREVPHATDRAVLDGAAAVGVSVEAGWVRIVELPFEAARGYHATLGRVGDERILSVKGAPEVVGPRCDAWRPGGTDQRLDGEARRDLAAHIDRLARAGQRVLAVAERRPVPGADDVLSDDDVTALTLLGFVGLGDPVRPEAASAVQRLGQAGVDIVMVTGDHPSTAEGVAAELGIANEHRVVTGDELDQMGDAQLDELLPEVAVFARVTPTHKRRIVEAFQRTGRPVAMTGDGANDAPAIRLADIGIAVGDRSTPAARDAADLIITTNRIETIIEAVIEGRSLWRSLREALAILVGGNLGEVLFTVAGAALTGRAPLSPRQLLVVNLLTDVAPALAIANRSPGSDAGAQLLAEGPERSLGGALNRAIAIRAATTGTGAATAWTIARCTGRRRRADTVGLVALVGTQLGQTLLAGGRDRGVLLAGLGSTVLLLGIVETPGISRLVDCTPLGPGGLAIAFGSATAATFASHTLSARLGTPAPPPLSAAPLTAVQP